MGSTLRAKPHRFLLRLRGPAISCPSISKTRLTNYGRELRIVVLWRWNGVSYEKIADLLALAEATVRGRYHRGMLELYRIVYPDYENGQRFRIYDETNGRTHDCVRPDAEGVLREDWDGVKPIGAHYTMKHTLKIEDRGRAWGRVAGSKSGTAAISSCSIIALSRPMKVPRSSCG